MDLSIKEAEALCYTAARGAGYSWGLAEEAGFAAAWLAKMGLSDLSEFADLLEDRQSQKLTNLESSVADCNWSSGGEGPLCPISTGAYLSDNQTCLLDGETISIKNVAHPLLMLPFVGNACPNSHSCIEMKWGNAKVCIKGEQISVRNEENSLNATIAENVMLHVVPDCTSRRQDISNRCTLSDPALSILHKFAHKTYVPETEELMRVGAGGENVDDDG